MFAHHGLRALFYPEAAGPSSAGAAVSVPPSRGAAASGAAAASAGGAAAAGAGGAAGAGAARAIRLLVLYDWENAHNALEPLKARVVASAAWHMLVLVPRGSTMETATSVEVVKATSTATEAAGTQLCFHAGMQHVRLPPSTAFWIVCGTEGRYEELVALCPMHRARFPQRYLVPPLSYQIRHCARKGPALCHPTHPITAAAAVLLGCVQQQLPERPLMTRTSHAALQGYK